MTEETLGQRIQRLRKGQNLSPESLGKRANLSGRAIEGIELDRITPQRDNLISLAKSLRVPVEYLRDGDRNEIARFAAEEFKDYDQTSKFIQYVNEKHSVTSFRNQRLDRDYLLSLKSEFLRANTFDAPLEIEMELFGLTDDEA